MAHLSPVRERDLEQLRGRRTLRLEDLLTVFTPTSAVADPVKFAGREKQVEQLTDALLSRDADLIVFGERGNGKTSLAHMLHDIATGDYKLLNYYGDLRRHLESKGLLPFTKERTKFTTIWADGFEKPVDEIISFVLTRRADDRHGPGLLAYIPNEATQIEIGSKIGFNKVFTGESSVKEVYTPAQPLNIKQGFELATQTFARMNPGKELLIIIDEFETIPDRAKISQYLKTAAARFALVGIASTTLDLLGEHASVARNTYGITLSPMSQQELIEILLIGRYILESFCTYEDEAIRSIARLAQGSPFWCHFLARGVLHAKIDSAGGWPSFRGSNLPVNITEEDVRQLVVSLPERADCQLYETALSQTVMGDDINKRVLQLIAAQPNNMISTAELRSSFTQNGIDEKIGQATVEGFLTLPGILHENGRIRDVVQFAFQDPNFRRYVLLRSGQLC
jgi:hypothetical protein